MNWVKQQLANVAGTQEPIYGPSAISSVADQARSIPFTELTRDGLKWLAMDSTSVETQTFYITADSGHIAMAQVIYSNVAGMRTTCQFNSKIFNYTGSEHLWNSDPLKNVGFDKEKLSFHADKCSVTLSDDASYYIIKSSTSNRNVVDLKISRLAPGFVVGHDGTTHFGTDLKDPWGSMRHAFWPRCKVEGTFVTQSGPFDMKGLGMFVHALQGMKPHHAAARWNFVDFQSPAYSAVMMDFTTPPSYGSTTVNVGGVAVDGKILYAGATNKASHTSVKGDAEVGWPEPDKVSFEWAGKTSEGADFHAALIGDLEHRADRVDVMAEVPKFVKQIVAGAAGTRPYIYQYTPKMTLDIKDGTSEHKAEGSLFMEATFIS